MVLGVKFALTPGKGTVILTLIPPHTATVYIDGKEYGRMDANNAYVMRDIPRYVKLIEKGKIDAPSVITKRYTLDESRQAVQDTADRTIITAVIEFT